LNNLEADSFKKQLDIISSIGKESGYDWKVWEIVHSRRNVSIHG
jgi:hypothetical protein